MTQIVRSNGPSVAPGSGSTFPWTMSATSSARRPAASHPRAGNTSASQNASSRPRAWRTPRLRAAAGPLAPCLTSRTGNPASSTIAAVSSREPSSTTITSNSPPGACACSASSVRGSVALASRAGTITLATASGMARETVRLVATTLAAVRIALTHALCWPEVRRGAERFVPELGAALVRRGHQVVHFSSAWEPGVSVERGVRTVRLRRRFSSLYRHEADFGLRVLPRLTATPSTRCIHSGAMTPWLRSSPLGYDATGRRTVVTDLGFPDREYWAQQGFVQAAAVSRMIAHIDVYSAMSQTAVETLAQQLRALRRCRDTGRRLIAVLHTLRAPSRAADDLVLGRHFRAT